MVNAKHRTQTIREHAEKFRNIAGEPHHNLESRKFHEYNNIQNLINLNRNKYIALTFAHYSNTLIKNYFLISPIDVFR